MLLGYSSPFPEDTSHPYHQLGQLQSGALASALGPMEAAVIGGFAVSLSALAFTFNPYMRRRIPEDVARTDAAVAAAASV